MCALINEGGHVLVKGIVKMYECLLAMYKLAAIPLLLFDSANDIPKYRRFDQAFKLAGAAITS